MKEKLEDFIGQAISKLDTSTFILLLPCVIILYVCLFVPNEELEHIFGLDDGKKEKVEVTCPHCGRSFIYYVTPADTIKSMK